MEVLVVGAGAVGRWLADTLRSAWPAARPDVAFTDRDRSAAAAAAADRPGTRVVTLEGEERFEAVCFAVPISAIEAAIAAQAARAATALVDVTGVMGRPVAAMREHAPDRERLSLHPLFAPAYAPGRIATVADASGPVTDRIRTALTEAGNELVVTTPEEHDRAMGTVQATTHAAVLSFALAAESVPEGLHTPVSETLSGLADRMLGGDPEVYAEIQATFDGRAAFAAAAERVAAADPEEFAALYREAGDRRAREE